MKKLMIAVAALMVSIAAYGQGQFVFNNRVPPDINARFQLQSDASGTSSLAGNAYLVQLLGGATGTAVGSLQALGTTDFRTGNASGYVNPLTVTVPGVAGGKDADVYVNVFSGAAATGKPLTQFGPYKVTVQEAPNPPLNLPMGTSPLIVTAVPEPATLALGVIGLGALLAIRRRK
jgi:MYXO-CTERM domain-containing protein